MQLCLAILPDYPSLNQVVGYQVTGLAVVFIALGSLWFMMELMGAVFRVKAARDTARVAATRAAQPTAPSPPSPLPPSETSPPALIAVIVAAVHTALEGRPHKIVSIQAPETTATWSAEGRRDVFVSHRVR